MSIDLAVIFGLGVVAGLRSMTAPMAVSWGVWLGWMDVSATSGGFLGFVWTRYVLTLLALGELVVDKLPGTPSRKSPPAFAFRLIVGAYLGATIAAGAGRSSLLGGCSGALGAVVGTIGGFEARTKLVKRFKAPDVVIALLEDALAVGGAFLLISR